MNSLYTVGLLACGLSLFAADDAALSNRAVTIDVDGAKFTSADVLRKNPAVLFQAQNALVEAERKAADEFVTDYLLERQAKKENLSVAELLKKHVDGAIAKDPSEEALRVYYDGVDTAQPFEEVRDKILDAIRQRRLAKAKTVYVQSLRSQANVSIRLERPRVNIALDKVQLRGSADAPVKVIEYADYECPYCQQIQPALAKLEAEFRGKIAFGYKDVPLPMHPNAQKAAEATQCAAAQGKYWEFHDLLYQTKQYTLPMLKEHAHTLSLDTATFNKCLDSGSTAEMIKASLAEATSFALPGTPGFFVNGRFITGAADYDILRRTIEEELREASSQKSQPLASR